MPDPVYTRLLEVANRLIGEKGKPAVIIKQVASGPEHDPTLTPTPHDVMFVETGYSMTNRDSSTIEAGDVMGLISMDNTTGGIDKEDLLEVDGIKLTLIDVQPLNPGGVDILTEVHARK